MSKVKIENISRTKSPFYCGLADKSSLALQYGQSKIVDETLVTDYIKGRQKAGVLKITVIPKVEEKKTSDSNKKNGGKRNENSNQTTTK